MVQSGPRLDKSGLEQLLAGLTAVRGGDFSTRLAKTGDPLMDEIATVFNGMADQLDLFTSEVAKGDLSQKIGVDARGEILELKSTLNTMVDQLSSFADEVTRVAREVGTEGLLGGQADVKGVSGTW